MNGAKANIILDNVKSGSLCGIEINCYLRGLDSEVNIYLKGENVLYNSNGTALQLYGTATVRITIIRTAGRKVLCGNITAIGSSHGAGIGGNKNEDSGSIIINGGL